MVIPLQIQLQIQLQFYAVSINLVNIMNWESLQWLVVSLLSCMCPCRCSVCMISIGFDTLSCLCQELCREQCYCKGWLWNGLLKHLYRSAHTVLYFLHMVKISLHLSRLQWSPLIMLAHVQIHIYWTYVYVGDFHSLMFPPSVLPSGGLWLDRRHLDA